MFSVAHPSKHFRNNMKQIIVLCKCKQTPYSSANEPIRIQIIDEHKNIINLVYKDL